MTLQSVEFAPDQAIPHELPPHGIAARFFCNMYPAFGIEATHNLKQFTYGVCQLSRVVDDAIDMPHIKTPSSFDNLVDRLNDGSLQTPRESDRIFSLRYIDCLNEEQLDYARALYSDACNIADQRNAATSKEAYVQAIVDEVAIQCGALVLSEALDRPDVPARQRYNRWLQSFILSGYLIDGAVDLDEDYKERRTQIAPTTDNKAWLLKQALAPGMETVRHTPAKAIPLLASMGLSYHVESISKRFSIEQIQPELVS